MKTQIGKERIYSKEWAERGRTEVVEWDVQPICSEQLIKITFISQNSPHYQGVRIGVDFGKGGIEIEGSFYHHDASVVWEPSTPKQLVWKCLTNKGLLSIYNIRVEKEHWSGHPFMYALSRGCGMLIEQYGDSLIYHCNDVGFDTNFDKLVFSIEKLPPDAALGDVVSTGNVHLVWSR